MTFGLVFCSVVFVSCGDQDLRRKMKEFMSNEIALPVELTEIKGGHMRSVKMTMNKPMLIVFYGVDECSSCAIDHLKDDLLGLLISSNRGNAKSWFCFLRQKMI